MSVPSKYEERIKSKVQRYRPGVEPAFAKNAPQEAEDVVIDYSSLRDGDKKRQRRTSHFEPEIVEDERYEKREKSEDDDEVRVKEESEESEDDEELDRRRQLARERLLQRQSQLFEKSSHVEKKESFEARIVNDDDEEEDEDSDDNGQREEGGDEYEEGDEEEYETDSEEERKEVIKPRFIPREQRQTMKEKEEEEKRQAEAKQKEAMRVIEKKRESHNKVVEEVRKEDEMIRLGQNPDATVAFASGAEVDVEEMNIPDDSDNINPEEEYENWKIRELNRIKQEKEEVEREEKEREDKERRSKMSDAEILSENRRLGIGKKEDESKYKFMQKYYHKGAFFMDTEDNIYKRDYNQPTLEDNFDKSTLRKVQQVKNFGLSGRTKWTHLLDNDTTMLEDKNAKDPNARYAKVRDDYGVNFTVQSKILKKMGGLKAGFDRPSGKTKKAE